MKKFFKENQKGFTLIELLVVIAILAVLATLYVPKIVSSANDAKETVAIANARTLASEITAYNASATDANKVKGSESGTSKVEDGESGTSKVEDGESGTSEPETSKSGTSEPYSWLANSGLAIVSESDITSNTGAKYLMDGREFPTSSKVVIVTDSKGNCFIVNASDGKAYAATE